MLMKDYRVATVPTACGIETQEYTLQDLQMFQLQQCLLLAVLKRFCPTKY